MPLTENQITRLAKDHLNALKNVSQMDNPSDQFPEITFDEAYAVQNKIMQIRQENGDPVVGHKAGFSVRASMRNFNISQPLFGHFHASMIAPEGEPLVLHNFIKPFVEGELAFVLKNDIKGPGVTLPKVMAAVAGVIPAFEIADAHLKGRPKNVQDIIAENTAAAKVMFGGQFNRIDGIDLRQIGTILEQDGDIVSTGAVINTCFNPLQPIVYMANKMAQFNMGLKAGEFIITGTPLPAATPEPGKNTSYRAIFDRFGYVSVRFVP